MRRAVIAVVLCLLLAATLTAAPEPSRETPPTIWYQGFLADVTTGEPINGTVDIVARLFSAPVGGTYLWGAEAHNGVVVTEGWFHIELGSSIPLPDFDGTSYYLDLTIDSEDLSARMKLGSVPAAFQAAHADSATATPVSVLWEASGDDVYRADGKVGIGTSSPSQTLHIKDDQNLTTGIIIENTDTGAGSGERISFRNEDGSLAFIHVYDDEQGLYPNYMAIGNNRDGGRLWLRTLTADVFMDTTGYVGIGTMSPEADLDVDGTLRADGIEMPTGASDGHVLTSDATGVAAWQAPTATDDGDWTVDGDTMYSAVAGSLGIGTTTPDALVHVETDGSEDFIFESTGSSGSVEFIAKTSGGFYDEMYLGKYGPTATGSTAGVPLAGLSRLAAGANAEALMLQVVDPYPMHFAVNDTVRMRIEGTGTVSILDVLHLEPVAAVPTNPENGDMIVYGSPGSQGLYIYINDFWELLVGIVKDGEDPNVISGAVER